MTTASNTSVAKPSKLKCWIEAMRLRTLPVSAAGVIAAVALAIKHEAFKPLPALICLLFALLAQIASNFANEYFDFRDGLDRKGRVGPRRGVTEGDITPRAMLRATIATLSVAALLGLSLIFWGGWWLIAAGVVIMIGALAYSTGPYPLSRHGWGEVAVVAFFGLVPVTLTYYVQAGAIPSSAWFNGLAMGLMGANVLIVNNYRDADDDAAVGKRTIAVIFGRYAASRLYLVNGIAAAIILAYEWSWFLALLYIAAYMTQWRYLCSHSGTELNPALGRTAMIMFLASLLMLVSAL